MCTTKSNRVEHEDTAQRTPGLENTKCSAGEVQCITKITFKLPDASAKTQQRARGLKTHSHKQSGHSFSPVGHILERFYYAGPRFLRSRRWAFRKGLGIKSPSRQAHPRSKLVWAFDHAIR
jgi:hypothetical protein